MSTKPALPTCMYILCPGAVSLLAFVNFAGTLMSNKWQRGT